MTRSVDNGQFVKLSLQVGLGKNIYGFAILYVAF